MSLFDLIKRLPGWPGGARRARRARDLEGMTRREFEVQVGKALRAQGYQVTPAEGGASAGVDLVLRRDRQTHLVRCERAQRVGVDVVQQLHRVMAARGAPGGIVVTSGRFSREATAFAIGCNIRLIEGPALAAMIQPEGASRTGATAPNATARR